MTIEPFESTDGHEISDTYAAQIESAMRAGWADPKMDEYNDYDIHRLVASFSAMTGPEDQLAEAARKNRK